MLAAFAVGQFQVNAINQREAALEAREKVIDQRLEQLNPLGGSKSVGSRSRPRKPL